MGSPHLAHICAGTARLGSPHLVTSAPGPPDWAHPGSAAAGAPPTRGHRVRMQRQRDLPRRAPCTLGTLMSTLSTLVSILSTLVSTLSTLASTLMRLGVP
jgi:hypothetical protein